MGWISKKLRSQLDFMVVPAHLREDVEDEVDRRLSDLERSILASVGKPSPKWWDETAHTIQYELIPNIVRLRDKTVVLADESQAAFLSFASRLEVR